MVDRLGHFTAIRTMETGGGTKKTGGTDASWAGRTKPWSSQTRSSDAGRFGGAAIENLIAIANQMEKDLWITLPFRADDDYIRRVALTMRYGSDGTNPYISPQAFPAFRPLDPSLRVYVEHGNEIWNSGYGYWANGNYDLSQAEIAEGDPHDFSYARSSSNEWGYAWRRVGYLAVRQSLIFREVFGEAAMMARVLPVIATQATIDNALLAAYDPVAGERTGARLSNGLPLADQSGTLYGRIFSAWAALGGGLLMQGAVGYPAGPGGMLGLCPPSEQSSSDPRLETGPRGDAVMAFCAARIASP